MTKSKKQYYKIGFKQALFEASLKQNIFIVLLLLLLTKDICFL